MVPDLREYKTVEFGVKLPGKFERNHFIPYDQVETWRKKFNNTGVYVTPYRFTTANPREGLDQHMVIADLYLDFDDEKDFENVREDVISVMYYLKTKFCVPFEVPNLYFSGKKGVHVVIDMDYLGIEPSPILNDIYKAIATDLKAIGNKNTLDTKIYDKVRLFRLVNSVHQDTKLYKIPITFGEIQNLTYEEIIDLAKEPRSLSKESFSTNPRTQSVVKEYYEKVKKPTKQEYKGDPIKIEGFTPCINWILHNPEMKGSRNEASVCIASACYQKGMSEDEVRNIIYNWNFNILNDPLPEREIEVSITQGKKYRYGCERIQLVAECDKKKCQLHGGKMSQDSDLKIGVPAEETLKQPHIINGRQTYDFEDQMWGIIDDVEKRNWARGSLGGFSFGDKMLDEALNGFQPAMYVLAGQPNIGKSMLALRLAWQVAKCNENAYVLYFAIDDPDIAILPRVISLDQHIPINVAKIPAKYMDGSPKHIEYMQKREKGLADLYNAVDRFKLIDKKFGYSDQFIIDTALQHQAKLDQAGLNKKVCVFIDNLYDVQTAERVADQQVRLARVSENLDNMCEQNYIPLFCTGELKKLNGARRPILDDLKDTIELQYDASAIMLCYNEVQIKGERADVFHEIAMENDEHGPVLEVHIAKNKLGDAHNRLFYHMYPGYSYLDPVDKPETIKYYLSKMSN